MKFILLLIILDAGGHRVMMDPTSVNWWTCRKTELRVAAGYADRYAGQSIIGAACIREAPTQTAYCPAGTACKA